MKHGANVKDPKHIAVNTTRVPIGNQKQVLTSDRLKTLISLFFKERKGTQKQFLFSATQEKKKERDPREKREGNKQKPLAPNPKATLLDLLGLPFHDNIA